MPTTRYLPGIRHSPLTAQLIADLRAVRERAEQRDVDGQDPRRADVFAKVGDSITKDSWFLRCWDSYTDTLGKHDMSMSLSELDADPEVLDQLEETRQFFDSVDLGGATSFSRNQGAWAMYPGWTTADLLHDSAMRLNAEVDAIHPGFAVVMIGTNEVGSFGAPRYERNLTEVVDALLAQDVIPILSTIPHQRSPEGTPREWVRVFNAVVRVVAQKRQIPMVDLYGALDDVTLNGLQGPFAVNFGSDGPDWVHLHSDQTWPHYSCHMSEAALKRSGTNHRNLLTLEALDRMRRLLVQDGEAEPAPPALAGAGTSDAPFVIDALPFVDVSGEATAYEITDLDLPDSAPAVAVHLYVDDGAAGTIAVSALANLPAGGEPIEVFSGSSHTGDSANALMASVCLDAIGADTVRIEVASDAPGARIVAVPLPGCL